MNVPLSKAAFGRPLRVALVLAAPYPSPQGSQVYVGGMARALRDRGHEVTVVAYGYGEGEPERGIARVSAPVPPGYRRMRAGPDAWKPAIDLGLAWRLAMVEADVWHLHNYEALAAGLIARRLRRGRGLSRIPLVYNNHNLLRWELPTYFDSFRGSWSALGGVADAGLPRRADGVVAITAGSAAALSALGCARVVQVPPGVTSSDFEGVRPRRAGEGKWLVYAGNPDAYQATEVLLAAMAHLPGWRLLVVTASDWAPPVATVVRTASWTEARDWIAGADVGALPRHLPGGFPLKLLNSLALGVPTVVARGAAQSLPGEVGVPDRDPAAFAAGVRSAERTEAERAQLSATILRDCAWSARAAEIEALYRDVGVGGAVTPSGRMS